MSKQSNQRYRKEKEGKVRENPSLNKADTNHNSTDKDKLNYREFNTASDSEKK